MLRIFAVLALSSTALIACKNSSSSAPGGCEAGYVMTQGNVCVICLSDWTIWNCACVAPKSNSSASASKRSPIYYLVFAQDTPGVNYQR